MIILIIVYLYVLVGVWRFVVASFPRKLNTKLISYLPILNGPMDDILYLMRITQFPNFFRCLIFWTVYHVYETGSDFSIPMSSDMRWPFLLEPNEEMTFRPFFWERKALIIRNTRSELLSEYKGRD